MTYSRSGSSPPSSSPSPSHTTHRTTLSNFSQDSQQLHTPIEGSTPTNWGGGVAVHPQQQPYQQQQQQEQEHHPHNARPPTRGHGTKRSRTDMEATTPPDRFETLADENLEDLIVSTTKPSWTAQRPARHHCPSHQPMCSGNIRATRQKWSRIRSICSTFCSTFCSIFCSIIISCSSTIGDQ